MSVLMEDNENENEEGDEGGGMTGEETRLEYRNVRIELMNTKM